MNLKNKKVKKCLLCGQKNLTKIFTLGNLYVSNFVKKSDIHRMPKCPLTLVYCKSCTLVQLSHIAPQEIMYKRFYWYRSGVTNTMKKGLKDIYINSLRHVEIKKKDVVLDIGANDGTMLNYYKKNFTTIGCEPAKNLTKHLKKNCHHVINNFWDKKNLDTVLKKNKLKKPKIITAIGMFYDLENPMKFIGDIAKSLDEKGIFVAQLMCLNSMIKQNDLGNICHEHIEFYSHKSLKYLFEKSGLEIFKLEENDINGGSYRIYARKYKRGSINLPPENVLSMLKNFYKRVNLNKQRTLNYLEKLRKKNKVVFLYGASTKGNTLLQYYNLDSSKIPFAAERSKEKFGKHTVGTGIRIISEKKARKMKPDYFFITPWAFIKEFIKREKTWRKKGGRFILPYPKFKII